MCDDKLDTVLGALVPDWDTRPPENPPGNNLAFRLRYIMEDTKSIFGKSKYSTVTRKKNRWTSRVHSDFVKQDPSPRTNSAPERNDRGAKMFMNWKVPDRVTTGDPSRCNSRNIRIGVDGKKNTIPHVVVPQSARTLPLIDIPVNKQANKPPSAVPVTPRLCHTARQPPRTESVARQAQVRASAPEFTRPMSNMSGKPASPRMPKSFKISELLSRYYTPSGTPEEWMANASEADRKMIKKALRLLDKDKMSKLDTTRAMENWIQNSSDRDRDVALSFFKSLTKEQVTGTEKVQQIVDYLKKRRPYTGAHQSRDQLPKEEDHKFRYLRLLSPQTRQNKWMHQTWHHLPPRQDDDPVNNRTAIYTEPQKIIPRHFVIHPDLG